MLQPALGYFRNETKKTIPPGPVGMNFASGSEKQLMLTQVHDPVAEFFFAVTF